MVGLGDDKFNANLMLAKIGEVNFHLGKVADARAAYSRMVVQKPEGAASKVGRRFGGLSAIAGGISTGRVSVSAPTSAVTFALEARKELTSIAIRSSIRVINSAWAGWLMRVTISKARRSISNLHSKRRQQSRRHCEAGPGQTFSCCVSYESRRHCFATRQIQGRDEVLQRCERRAGRQAPRSDVARATRTRTQFVAPGRAGEGCEKAMTLRESAVANYRESLTTIETLRQGSLRADESRTTFLATIKDVFDEAASAYASLALLTNPSAGAPLSGKSLEYAGEAFRINEQSRARSLSTC